LNWGENIAPQVDNAQNNQPKTEENKNAQTGRFKVGERVLASPAFRIEDDWFEKCTVVKDMMIAFAVSRYRSKRTRWKSPAEGFAVF